jgi:hypothetical protein
LLGTGRVVSVSVTVHVSSGGGPRPPPSTNKRRTALVTRVVQITASAPAAAALCCTSRLDATPRHAKRDAESHDTTRHDARQRNAETGRAHLARVTCAHAMLRRPVRSRSRSPSPSSNPVSYPRVRPTPISGGPVTGNAMRQPAAAVTRPRPREGSPPSAPPRRRATRPARRWANNALPSRIVFGHGQSPAPLRWGMGIRSRPLGLVDGSSRRGARASSCCFPDQRIAER